MGSKSKKRTRKKSPRPVRKQICFDRPGKADASLYFSSFEITTEPINDLSVPEEVCDEMGDLFEKSQGDPGSIIGRIEELIDKYPNVPQLYNYASVAYSKLGNEKRSRFYVEKNYKNNRDYLFAKLNYAEVCMSDGDIEKVPEIFDNKFDLKMLYPERDIFHITEVVGFMGVTATYFFHVGRNDLVEALCRGLRELAPDSPYTKRIGQYLLMEKIKNKFNQLIAKK